MTRARGDSTKKGLVLRSTRKARGTSLSKDIARKDQGGLTTADTYASTDFQVGASPVRTEKLTSEEVSKAHELLRQFDMAMRYGPCVGMPRSSRWERARRFGLNPPDYILEILRDVRYRQAILNIEENLWYDELNYKASPM